MPQNTHIPLSRAALEQAYLQLQAQLAEKAKELTAKDELLAIRDEQLKDMVSRQGRLECAMEVERATREEMVQRELKERVRTEVEEEQQRLKQAEEEMTRANEARYEEMMQINKARYEEMMRTNMARYEEMMRKGLAELEKAKADGEKRQKVAEARRGQTCLKILKDCLDELATSNKAYSVETVTVAREICAQTLRLLEAILEKKTDVPSAMAELLQTIDLHLPKESHTEFETLLEQMQVRYDAKKHVTEELLKQSGYTQKSEKHLLTEAEHLECEDCVKNALPLDEREKAEYEEICRRASLYRQRLNDIREMQQQEQGHGRTLDLSGRPRLRELVLWPEGYEGHEEDYTVISEGETKEVLVRLRYQEAVQPYRRPVCVRKDDPLKKPIVASYKEEMRWNGQLSCSMVAHLEVMHFVYHLPWNRIEQMLHDMDLNLSQSTMDEYHKTACERLAPLYKLLEKQVMGSRYLAGDGTPMPLLDKERHRTKNRYVIAYRSIDTGIPLFVTTPGEGSGRGKSVIQENLKEWDGVAFMSDAYAGYDHIGKEPSKILCRCNAHARRKIEGAMKENAEVMMPALALYQDIYVLEAIIKNMGLEGKKKVRFRRDFEAPIFAYLKQWCETSQEGLPQNSLTRKAIGYFLGHYKELTAYINIAEMPIDNNDTERVIRKLVMGRKAFLYYRNEEAVQNACVMYSLLGACRMLEKNPEHWLADVLGRIPQTKEENLHTLMPSEWVDFPIPNNILDIDFEQEKEK